jgi:hypothetical protein
MGARPFGLDQIAPIMLAGSLPIYAETDQHVAHESAMPEITAEAREKITPPYADPGEHVGQVLIREFR